MKVKRYTDKRSINYLFHTVLWTFEVGPQNLDMDLSSGKTSKMFCACESPLGEKLFFNQGSYNSFSVMPDVLISGNLEYNFFSEFSLVNKS